MASVRNVGRGREVGIVRGRRDITADTAMRLARYFGTTPEFWVNLQTAYDLSRVAAERGTPVVIVRRATSTDDVLTVTDPAAAAAWSKQWTQ